MKTEVKEIPFNGNTLLGVKDASGQVWLAVKKACLDIGLSEGQARKQVENIQKDKILKSNCRYLAIVQNEGNREVKREQLFVNEKVVTLWLAKITLTDAMLRKTPEAYNKLVSYQLEAADVLHKAFYETEEQKSNIQNKLGLDGRIEVMTVQINNMESMLEVQAERFDSVMENMTISTRQQEKILKAVRRRVNFLLNGAHSVEYKRMGRTYLANLWNNFKSELHCGSSYKDLNPVDFQKALDWIETWEYVEA